MKIFYSVLFMCSMIAIAVGRRNCYECTSYNSWSDCQRSARKVYCPNYSYDDCGKLKVTTTNIFTGAKTTKFIKSCTQTCNKHDLAICQKYGKSCDEYYCCNSDYCNTGSRLVASLPFGMLAFAATVIAVFTSKMMM